MSHALDALTPAGCKVGLVVFEQNACRDGERFGAALDRAAAFNALAALGTRVAAAASSQLWTAGSHYDGCGEGAGTGASVGFDVGTCEKSNGDHRRYPRASCVPCGARMSSAGRRRDDAAP